MDLASAMIGLGAGLILTAAKYLADWLGRTRQRELGNAALLGKLDAGFAMVTTDTAELKSRLSLMEKSVVQIGGKLDEQGCKIDEQSLSLSTHIRDEMCLWEELRDAQKGCEHAGIG